jgi:hypothetical protein
MHSYTSFLAVLCPTTGTGKWTVLNCPHHAKWTVALSGKASCQDPTKLYLLAAIAALDDFTMRCNVTLTVDNVLALDALEAIGSGLRPAVANLSVTEALQKQFDRHAVTLVHVPYHADTRWKTALANLKH